MRGDSLWLPQYVFVCLPQTKKKKIGRPYLMYCIELRATNDRHKGARQFAHSVRAPRRLSRNPKVDAPRPLPIDLATVIREEAAAVLGCEPLENVEQHARRVLGGEEPVWCTVCGEQGRCGLGASVAQVADWSRLAEAGGRPGLALALAGRAGGRNGRSEPPGGCFIAWCRASQA